MGRGLGTSDNRRVSWRADSLLGWDMSLRVILNGQSREFEALAESARLDALIGELGLKGDRVAVEHNGEIVPRAGWSETLVNGGDRIEVVHFVGGGVT